MNILPLTYLGNIQYFTKLCFTDCMIDIHEHYVKQSYRTRCEILTAGGRTMLAIPVVKPDNFNKPAIKEVRIDYSKRWQHQHWQSLVSAYRNSPYFDFYEETFEPFFIYHRYEFLADLDLELTTLILKLLGAKTQLTLSEAYIEPSTGDADYRRSLSSKPRLYTTDDAFRPQPYYQVFSEKMPFVPNLSIIDLLFCEGPDSLRILRESIK